MPRTLPSSLLALALLIATLNLPAAARAADAAPLPPEACAADVAMVVHLDLTRLTQAQADAAIKAIGGDHATLLNEGVKAATLQRDELINAGVDRVIMFACAGPDGDALPVAMFGLKAGADPAATEPAILRVLFGAHGDQMPFQLQLSNGWLIFCPFKLPSTTTNPILPPALKQVGDAPAYLIFMPTATLRDHLTKELEKAPPAEGPPASVRSLVLSVANAEWISISAHLGDKPTFSAVFQMADEGAAKKLLADHDQASKDLLDVEKQVPADHAGRRLKENQLIASSFYRQLSPKQNGSRVMINGDAAELRKLVTALAPGIMRARQTTKEAASMSNMRQLAFAVQFHAGQNQGAMPDKLNDLKGDSEEAWKKLLTNPRNGAFPGYAYTKPAAKLDEVQNRSTTPILHELTPDGKIDPQGTIAYADGHVARPEPPAPKPQ